MLFLKKGGKTDGWDDEIPDQAVLPDVEMRADQKEKAALVKNLLALISGRDDGVKRQASEVTEASKTEILRARTVASAGKKDNSKKEVAPEQVIPPNDDDFTDF